MTESIAKKTPTPPALTEAEDAPAKPEDVPEAMAALRGELAATQDNYLRALAELENQRRRSDKEKAQLADFAIASFARELLPIADGLARAKLALEQQPEAAQAAAKPLAEGVALVARELAAIFRRHKIEPVGKIGEVFDPNWHEAMMELPAPNRTAGEIVAIMEPGYAIAGRLLRPARVGIAKGSADKPS